MELMLKIDLTEEQYNDLMTKSYKEIFESDEFKKSLAKTISEGILNCLKSTTGESIIRCTLTGETYSNNAKYTNVGNHLFDEATKEYVSEISEPIKKFMQECFLKTDIDALCREIVIRAFAKGLVSGTDREFMDLREQLWSTDAKVQDLKSKLTIY